MKKIKNNTIIKHSYTRNNHNMDLNKKHSNNEMNNNSKRKDKLLVFDSNPAIQ